MERDKKLEQLIKEHTLISAPDNFTDLVIDKVKEPLPISYKPLIGKVGRISIFVFVALVIVLSIFSVSAEASEPIFNIPEWEFALPEMNWKIPSGLLAGLVAVLILALTDARLNRSRTS